jgi:hypothetical protein
MNHLQRMPRYINRISSRNFSVNPVNPVNQNIEARLKRIEELLVDGSSNAFLYKEMKIIENKIDSRNFDRTYIDNSIVNRLNRIDDILVYLSKELLKK